MSEHAGRVVGGERSGILELQSEQATLASDASGTQHGLDHRIAIVELTKKTCSRSMPKPFLAGCSICWSKLSVPRNVSSYNWRMTLIVSAVFQLAEITLDIPPVGYPRLRFGITALRRRT